MSLEGSFWHGLFPTDSSSSTRRDLVCFQARRVSIWNKVPLQHGRVVIDRMRETAVTCLSRRRTNRRGYTQERLHLCRGPRRVLARWSCPMFNNQSLLLTERWCRVSGVRLGHHTHHYSDASSGVTLWPISGQQPVLRHTKAPGQLSWTLDGVETNKVPGTSFRWSKRKKRRAKSRQVALVLSVEKDHYEHCTGG